jgi:4-hydroxybenzoate polyprenyltransferase
MLVAMGMMGGAIHACPFGSSRRFVPPVLALWFDAGVARATGLGRDMPVPSAPSALPTAPVTCLSHPPIHRLSMRARAGALARACLSLHRPPYHGAMRRIVRRTIAAIELSRLPVAFGAVANVWLMILLCRADARLGELPVASQPLWRVLGAGWLVAVGFLAFGAALNDFLDAKHDRAFAPDRPLPAGNLRPRRAAQIAAISLLGGLFGSLAFGTTGAAMAMSLAAVILVYDAFAKHVPSLGIVLAGLATALSMAVPCTETTTLLPIWLAMSQTMGVGALAYVLGEKRPKLTRRSALIGATGWIFWTAVLLALELERNDGRVLATWTEGGAIAIPAATVLVGAAVGYWKLRTLRGSRAGEKILRYGSLWKSLVASAWLVAAGMHLEAAAIAAIAAVAFGTVAILREAGPQLAEPVSWRS